MPRATGSAERGPVRVDRTPPAIAPAAPPAFSPNGDGVADTRPARPGPPPSRSRGLPPSIHGSTVVRSWTIAEGGRVRRGDLGRHGRVRRRGRRTGRTRSASPVATRPATPPRAAIPVRVDRTLGSARAGRRRPSTPRTATPSRRPRGSPSASPARRPSAPRSTRRTTLVRTIWTDRTLRRGGPHLDAGTAGTTPARSSARGHVHAPGHRPERDRDDGADPRHPRRRLCRSPCPRRASGPARP